MRPEAGHSMMASRSSTARRATRTMRRALPDQRMGWPQCARRTRMPRNRTSRTESRATALYPSRPTCNGRRHWPSRSRREQKRRARTRDEADKEALGAPSCGRSQTLLYNTVHPHSRWAIAHPGSTSCSRPNPPRVRSNGVNSNGLKRHSNEFHHPARIGKSLKNASAVDKMSADRPALGNRVGVRPRHRVLELRSRRGLGPVFS